MNACINKEQQVPEDQQAAKSAMEHTNELERAWIIIYTLQKYIETMSASSSLLSPDELMEKVSDDSSDSETK